MLFSLFAAFKAEHDLTLIVDPGSLMPAQGRWRTDTRMDVYRWEGDLHVIALLHPGFVEPAAVQSAIPAVGFLVAGVAQIVNVVYHRKAQIAAIAKA